MKKKKRHCTCITVGATIKITFIVALFFQVRKYLFTFIYLFGFVRRARETRSFQNATFFCLHIFFFQRCNFQHAAISLKIPKKEIGNKMTS